VLVDAMTQGAALVTVDGVIRLHNRRLGELATGSTETSLVGWSLDQLLGKPGSVSIERLALQASPVEIALARRDGRSIPVQVAARAASLAGRRT
jgi:hypothetical protein